VKPEDIRTMYRAEREATADEMAATARAVATDPEMARSLWEVVLAMAPTDPEFSTLLQAVISSAVVDSISNGMQRDDNYALVIGRRIMRLMEAMKPGSVRNGKKVKTS
jgi:hypothetical protein